MDTVEHISNYNTAFVERAHLIAYTAHCARGQFRADKKTPYIKHPERVAQLVMEFDDYLPAKDSNTRAYRIIGALLHDVIEDTKINRDHLIELGTPFEALYIVERLTKPDGGPAPASYYEGIAESEDALLVKCADRCANLEDSYNELLAEVPEEPRRWEKYIAKTATDVLPLYENLPELKAEIQKRLDAIGEVLPGALERRHAYVEHQREKANLDKVEPMKNDG